MATSTLNAYNSSLATDPLRTFRFKAVFSIPSTDTALFDQRIGNSNGTSSVSGTSTGWVGGFSTISGLSIATQNIPYREGGMNTTVHQIPGMTTFQPLTFTRGAIFGNDQAITWMRGLFSASAGNGLNSGGGGFRVNIDITVNNHPNTNVPTEFAAMKFSIFNAWIINLSYTDLDATNGALMFETMQLVHEGINISFTQPDGTPVGQPSQPTGTSVPGNLSSPSPLSGTSARGN
jgi:phage tail-like protein